ncbi:phospho-2-dehydro-3-deoxyheptonate aldolase [Bombiscardovia apis]|uniref:Phospho-2-dehydro-3-deoxyheptonate aldolase n=1 Tax=Bombiscardovia apis TaxID=2932182 RepID=A0ABM8BE86_9BIFI|nr:3-deoxy-7-phosphoheptulonate synthase [Bombiscardovia apis]BDR55206.1 phospho-2-dehydro-3-deoxyheptonate aldolase [Bombiscardovia apis]
MSLDYLEPSRKTQAAQEALSEGVNPLFDPDAIRWEDEVGIGHIVNRRIIELDPLPTPAQILTDYPLDQAARDLVISSRESIRQVLQGEDDRLLVIVGPCSIHDPKAALEYAQKLAALNEQLEDRLLIVMRAYFEKPRTTMGWKGLINDPDVDGSHKIRKGLVLARRVLLSILGTGLPAATEFLEPTSPQFTADAISWGAIGARNTESQVHRQLASGLSMPIGFKNATDGDVGAAIDSCFTASRQHTFFGINHEGRASAVQTLGNPDCHLVLRGSSHGPNCEPKSVSDAMNQLREGMPTGSAAAHGLIIDASHGNSGKDELRQAALVEELAERIAAGEPGITGIMMESFLEGGNQSAAPLSELTYGQSITDRCIAWPRTAELLQTLAQAVESRRQEVKPPTQ